MWKETRVVVRPSYYYFCLHYINLAIYENQELEIVEKALSQYPAGTEVHKTSSLHTEAVHRVYETLVRAYKRILNKT